MILVPFMFLKLKTELNPAGMYLFIYLKSTKESSEQCVEYVQGKQ